VRDCPLPRRFSMRWCPASRELFLVGPEDNGLATHRPLTGRVECQGKCPRCQKSLWPVAVPRKIRFHDLRHTTATLLLQDGVSLPVVQRILRHSDPRLTTETYGHLEVTDMRAALGRLSFGVKPQAKPFGALVVQDPENRKMNGRDALEITSNVAALKWSGRQDSNLRPLGPEPSALPG
jgi:hypothetical protein